MEILLSFIGAFLLGSIPTGYLVAKYFKKIDIREHGSGNVGATNVSRVLGRGLGLYVFTMDFLKGFLPVIIFRNEFGQAPSLDSWAVWVGFGAILGHIYTPFLGFKGGKGIATGAGVVCSGTPLIFILAISIWGLFFLVTRIVSLSSLVALFVLTASALLFPLDVKERIFLLTISALGVWTHRPNIWRLLRGEEKPNIKR